MWHGICLCRRSFWWLINSHRLNLVVKFLSWLKKENVQKVLHQCTESRVLFCMPSENRRLQQDDVYKVPMLLLLALYAVVTPQQPILPFQPHKLTVLQPALSRGHGAWWRWRRFRGWNRRCGWRNFVKIPIAGFECQIKLYCTFALKVNFRFLSLCELFFIWGRTTVLPLVLPWYWFHK